MKTTMPTLAIALAAMLVACVGKDHSKTEKQTDTIVSKTKTEMQPYISIVEIPTKDFGRAVTFYQNILDISIEETQMADIKMGLFPNRGGTFVQLIHGADYKPSSDGVTIYLNAGEN